MDHDIYYPQAFEHGTHVLTASEPNAPDFMSAQPPRLLDRLRARLRVLHYSIRTEQVYVDWARSFILFHGKRHPRDMGAIESGVFLSDLAVERQVSASIQKQAQSALLFLFKERGSMACALSASVMVLISTSAWRCETS